MFFRKLTFLLACACALAHAPRAMGAVTVTGSNGVIYDIIGSSTDVVVSDKNAVLFSTLAVPVVIPATVTDCSTNPVSGTFTVRSVAPGVFRGCSLLPSVRIEAPVTEIPADSFRDCTALTGVEFTSSVTSIGPNAFSQCSSLISVGTLENVTTIGTEAFKDCSSLPSVTLPGSLGSIGVSCFENCSSLASIEIPGSLAVIPESAFRNCTSLATASVAGGVEQIGMRAFADCRLLASPLLPESVVSVGERCFENCTALGQVVVNSTASYGNHCWLSAGMTGITWPEATPSVGAYAFQKVSQLEILEVPHDVGTGWFTECPDLRSVAFTEGCSEIAAYAFQNCPALSRLSMSQGVSRIQRGAFSGCAQLMDFDFPARMELIGESAFEGCSALENLKLPAGAALHTNAFAGTGLSTIDWPADAMGEIDPMPFGNYQNGVVEMHFPAWMQSVPGRICHFWENLKRVSFDEGVESLGTFAFSSCKELEEVRLPDGLKRISDNVFCWCTSLRSVELPATLEFMGFSAFGYSGLESVAMPGSLTTLEGYIFQHCDALASAALGEGIVSLPEASFSECPHLASVTLPSTLRSIGTRTFLKCWELKAPVLPSGLEAIGSEAFLDCLAYGDLELNAGVHVGDGAFSGAFIPSIAFPAEPCSFGSYCFRGNQYITHIDFPDWMEEIPTGFCCSFKALESVTLPAGLKSIGAEAFRWAVKLHDVDIPESTIRLLPWCFAGITGKDPAFGKVVLSNGVEIAESAFEGTTVTSIEFKGCASFGANVFKDVTSIEHIVFPNCMNEIPDGFCSGWDNLSGVELPDSLERIGNNVFQNCRNLRSVVLPEGITYIGSGAFSGSKLEEFTWPPHPVTLGTGVFSGTPLKSIVIPNWMAEIPASTFKGCSDLTEVIWEERDSDGSAPSVSIGNEAFSECAGLPRIKIPPCPYRFGSNVFRLCTGAESIDWGEFQGELGIYSFYGCKSLTEVEIPNWIESIPGGCFQECSSLRKASLGENVTAIGEWAFCGSGLEEAVWPGQLETIGAHAFQSTPIREVLLPESVKAIGYQSFLSCPSLKSLRMPGVCDLGGETFKWCGALEDVILPGTLKNVGSATFYGDTSLERVTVCEGVENMGTWAFMYSGLTELELPSSVTFAGGIQNYGFSSLRKVVSHALDLTVGESCFNCTPLEEFISDGHIAAVYKGGFAGTPLRVFECPEGESIGEIGDYAFSGTQITEIPYLDHTLFHGQYMFQNCNNLRQLTMPDNTSYLVTYGFGFAMNTPSLQSITFQNTLPESKFFINGSSIAGAPLRALSYALAKDLVPLNDRQGRTPTIDAYYQSHSSYAPAANPSASKLMVVRGEKWKYHEAGYNTLFDIHEIKSPELNLEGGIYSTFDPEKNVNHYKASVRWDVPLSDLNADGETRVTLFRDNVRIAEVLFGKPSEPVWSDKFGKEVIEVDVKVKREGETEYSHTSFTGDFHFPVKQADGTVVYEMQYNISEPVMSFDAVSHRRQLTFDKYGYTSYFTFVDEFDSPALDSGNVPACYAYSAKMDAYGYEIPVNNPGLEPGDDGLLWHYEARNTRDMEDGYVLMPVAMAMPTLSGPGIYSLEEVKGDLNHALPATIESEMKLAYNMDALLLAQRGRIDGTIVPMFDNIEAWCYSDDGRRTLSTTTPLVSAPASGELPLQDAHAVVKGRRYQTVVQSRFKGTFGSPTITIPGIPVLKSAATATWAPHYLEEYRSDKLTPGHPEVVHVASLILRHDVTEMGYDDNDPGEAPGANWHLGLWRTIDNSAVMRAAAEGEDSNAGTLLHHVGGLADNEDPSVSCGGCASGNGLGTASEGEMLYTDHYDYRRGGQYVAYHPRLYVKVPQAMVPGQEVWMAADAPVEILDRLPTGVEETLCGDTDGGNCRWFTLQGTEVANPGKGIFIRVKDGEAAVVTL